MLLYTATCGHRNCHLRGKRALDLPLGLLRGMLVLRSLLDFCQLQIIPYCNLEQLKKGFMLEIFVHVDDSGHNLYVYVRYIATLFSFMFLCKRLGNLWMFQSPVVAWFLAGETGKYTIIESVMYLYSNQLEAIFFSSFPQNHRLIWEKIVVYIYIYLCGYNFSFQ